jgi:hypothetical protein
MRPGFSNKPHDGNDRETGARKYPWSQDQDKQSDQRAATPKPDKPYGLTQPVNETSEKTRQSEGVDQRTAVKRKDR